MNWYKKAESHMRMNYPYSLLETIKMQGEKGLSLSTMDFHELKEAKEILEPNGFIKKVVMNDDKGKYSAYVINEEKTKSGLPDNTEAVRKNRPTFKESSLRWAKMHGVEITPDENLVLFHGTSPRNAKLIERTRRLNMGTYLASDMATAERFGYQAIRSGKPVVLRVVIDPSTVLGSSYWALNEDVFLGDDGVYRPKA